MSTIKVNKIGNTATADGGINVNSSGNVGIGTSTVSTRLDVEGNGVPVEINSANSNSNKVQLSDAGTVRGYFGASSTASFLVSGNGGSEQIRVQSTGGISFNGDTAAANALDDYEEGTFTPTLVGASSGAASAYSQQYGGYVKVGNLVHVFGYLKITNKGSISGAVKVGGFPFPVVNLSNYFHAPAVGWYTGLSGVTAYGLGFDIAPNTSVFTITRGTGTSVSSVAPGDITNTFGIEWAFTYRTA